jgi:hypothetical protein
MAVQIAAPGSSARTAIAIETRTSEPADAVATSKSASVTRNAAVAAAVRQ